jgi:hypothetical protein
MSFENLKPLAPGDCRNCGRVMAEHDREARLRCLAMYEIYKLPCPTELFDKKLIIMRELQINLDNKRPVRELLAHFETLLAREGMRVFDGKNCA